MEKAIKAAYKAFDKGEVPVGAAIIRSNKIISCHYNQVETLKTPLAHAELLAIYQAQKKLKTKYLDNCDIYVTLEPCAMCSYAISLSRIRRIYFGAYDIKNGGIEHGQMIFKFNQCNHVPEIIGGIQEKACKNLLKLFFIKKR
jgi:tRNA(adenine34) deaminase